MEGQSVNTKCELIEKCGYFNKNWGEKTAVAKDLCIFIVKVKNKPSARERSIVSFHGTPTRDNMFPRAYTELVPAMPAFISKICRFEKLPGRSHRINDRQKMPEEASSNQLNLPPICLTIT